MEQFKQIPSVLVGSRNLLGELMFVIRTKPG